MGGSRSGRWGRRSRRLCVEDTLTLHIEQLTPGLRHGNGHCATGRIECCVAGVQPIAVRFVLNTAPAIYSLILRYTVNVCGEEVTLEDRARLRTSPVPFGRVRWRLACPRCHRTCSTLHLPVRSGALFSYRFACRRCHHLAYRSQRIGTGHRWQRRADKLFAAAGTTSSADVHEKPKRMRWATFERLLAEAEEWDDAASAYWLRTIIPALDRIAV